MDNEVELESVNLEEDLALSSSGDEDEREDCEEEEENWDVKNGEPMDPSMMKYLCLFHCKDAFENVAKLFDHLRKSHQFDVEVLKKKFNMDQESFIKMVNWRRALTKASQGQKDTEMLNMIGLKNWPETIPPPWKPEIWLCAQNPEDPLLGYWFEEHNLCEKESILEDDLVSLLEPMSIEDLGTNNVLRIKEKLHISQLENTRLLKALQRVVSDNGSMRTVMDRMMSDSSKSPKAEAADRQNDEWYFDSYDELSIHAEMIRDEPRTIAYRDSIMLNKEDIQDKIVMDLGCGTGILSFFCVEAGAVKVHAVDNSKIIFDAMDICFENHLEQKVNFIAKKLELIDEKEVGKVDILVSEWMGYFLNFEGMLSSYLDARDKFLKPGGIMLPSTAQVYLVAVSDNEVYNSRIESWEDVYGYKMTVMKKKWIAEPAIHYVDKKGVVSNEIIIKNLDLHTCKFEDTSINGDFELVINKDCELTAICGYFTVGFLDCQQKMFLNTSPFHENTHWKQTIFYLPRKYKVAEDDVVKLRFECQPHPDNSRWLKIRINVFNEDLVYEMK